MSYNGELDGIPELTFDCAFYRPMYLKSRSAWVPGVEPVLARLTWLKLVAGLTRFRESPSKAECAGWQPVALSRPYRKLENVSEVSCLVLDCDDGATPEDVSAVWSSWPHIWHTTWGSTAERPKLRLIVPLETPCPAEWFPRLWHHAQSKIGGAGDEQAKDASRYYYLPAKGPAGDCRWGVHDPGGYFYDPRPWERLPETPMERTEREARDRMANRVPCAPTVRSDRQRSRELNESSETRLLLGQALGGQVHADRVTDIPCPACGRRSVWWPLVPVKTPKAMCEHRKSCGWTGWLDTMEGA